MIHRMIRRVVGLGVALLSVLGLTVGLGANPAAAILGPTDSCVNVYKPGTSSGNGNVIARVCAGMVRSDPGDPPSMGYANMRVWNTPGGGTTGGVWAVVLHPHNINNYGSGRINDGVTWNGSGGITWGSFSTLRVTIDTAEWAPDCVHITYGGGEVDYSGGC